MAVRVVVVRRIIPVPAVGQRNLLEDLPFFLGDVRAVPALMGGNSHFRPVDCFTATNAESMALVCIEVAEIIFDLKS